MKRTFDAEFFDGKCPYTDKPCYEWECDTCEIDSQEKEAMNTLDNEEHKEWLESERKQQKHGTGGLTMDEIENPCFHCYQGAIGECIRCEHGGKWWSGDLGAETIEVDDDDLEQEG